MKVTLVVPVHNESKRIEKFLTDLANYNYPIIIVNDGSTDDSKLKIKELLRKRNSKFEKIILVSHKVNLGKGAAMKTGAEAAFLTGADAIVFMDSDGQHDPKDLSKFIEKIAHFDVVYGERTIGKHFRLFGSRLSSLLASALFGVSLNDLLCGYRGITEKAYKKIVWESAGYGVETEMVVRAAKNKLSYTSVPVKSIYHDVYKGFSLFDGFKLFFNIFFWKVTI